MGRVFILYPDKTLKVCNWACRLGKQYVNLWVFTKHHLRTGISWTLYRTITPVMSGLRQIAAANGRMQCIKDFWPLGRSPYLNCRRRWKFLQAHFSKSCKKSQPVGILCYCCSRIKGYWPIEERCILWMVPEICQQNFTLTGLYAVHRWSVVSFEWSR